MKLNQFSFILNFKIESHQITHARLEPTVVYEDLKIRILLSQSLKERDYSFAPLSLALNLIFILLSLS